MRSIIVCLLLISASASAIFADVLRAEHLPDHEGSTGRALLGYPSYPPPPGYPVPQSPSPAPVPSGKTPTPAPVAPPRGPVPSPRNVTPAPSPASKSPTPAPVPAPRGPAPVPTPVPSRGTPTPAPVPAPARPDSPPPVTPYPCWYNSDCRSNPAGSTCCFGKCVNTTSDNKNCLICGLKCLPGFTCCNSLCVNLDSNVFNCGMCGYKCTKPSPFPWFPPVLGKCSYGVCV